MTTRMLRPDPSGRQLHPSPPGRRAARTQRGGNRIRQSFDRSGGAAGGAPPWSFAGLLREQPGLDADAAWKLYRSSEEYLQLRVLLRSLGQLPEEHAPGEQRADYEFCLHALGRLGDLLEVEKICKHYRAYYSPEVQLTGYLYSTLLTAFTLLPSYLLNGQEYYVSDTVLDQCGSLQNVFSQTCREIQRHFENLAPHTLLQVRADVKRTLVYFDRSWCRFEIPALEEIEAIHRQACRPLIEAIQVESLLAEQERTRPKGPGLGPPRIRESVQRSRLMEKVCELNVLANLDGKCRSDLDLACIVEAEKIAAAPVCCAYYCRVLHPVEGGCGHVCSGQCSSPVVMRLAKTLLSRFAALRRLLRRYARCLYQVNSHLANNPELVTALERFETAWELAQKYLLTPKYKQLALHAFGLVTQVTDRSFHVALQDLEPELLIKLSHALLLYEMLQPSAAGVKRGEKGGKTCGAELPRPGSLPPAQQASVAAGFLPPARRGLAAETAAAVAQLSEEQLRAVHAALIHPDSRPATARPESAAESTGGREPRRVSSASNRRPQPCPPRLVPATPLRAEEKERLEPAEEEEDDMLPIELPLAEPPPAPESEEAGDPAVRAVVAHVSALGMHLQRHDPSGWNELVQIVLQGVLFAAKGCGNEPAKRK